MPTFIAVRPRRLRLVILLSTALGGTLARATPVWAQTPCSSPVITSCTNSTFIPGGLAVTTGTTIGALVNSGTINGANYGIENSGSIGTLVDSGTISGTDYDISNSGNIGILATAGQIISAENPAFINAAGSTITDKTALTVNANGFTINEISGIGVYNGLANASMTNNGTITAVAPDISFAAGSVQPMETYVAGIYNDTTGSLNSLNNEGVIQAASAIGVGVFNLGTIAVLNNEGEITTSGTQAAGIANEGSIGTLINSGEIKTSGTFSYGILSDFNIGTLNNSGDITASGDNAIGISNIGSTSTLVNSGTINGADYGIENSGSIGTFIDSGAISGADYGIANSGGIGTFIDSGAISGTDYDISNSGNIGILATAGQIISAENPAFINAAGSTITDKTALTVNANGFTINEISGIGVYNGLANASMTNNGTITAIAPDISFAAGSVQPMKTYLVGIYNDTSGSLSSLNNEGVIQATNASTIGIDVGVFNFGTIAVLNNEGEITTSGTQAVGIASRGSIGTLSNSGEITASSSMSYGIYNIANIGTLNNSGEITASGGSSIGIVSLNTGTLNNSGEITANGDGAVGIYAGGNTGTLINSGTISGTDYGIENIGSIGEIIDSGLISGTDCDIFNSSTIGTIASVGQIVSSANPALINTAGTTITDKAAITVNNDGGQITWLMGVGVYNALSNADITNNGTINAITPDIGITLGSEKIEPTYLVGIYNDESGSLNSLNNSGKITANDAGSVGIGNLGTIGTLNNSGEVTASGTNSSGITNIGTIGTLNNSGMISDSSYGIINTGSIGEIINSGTISGTDYGIENIGSIDEIIDSGLISGADYDVVNSGTIDTLASVGQIVSTENPEFINAAGSTIADSAALTVDNNGGTIGTLIGVGVYNGLGNVSMTNNGTINANMSNISFAAGSVQPGSTDFVGIYNDASGSLNSLNNSGKITVSGTEATGIGSFGTIGTLNNSGEITASGDNAIGIRNTGTIGTLFNSATISGADYGVENSSSGSIGTLIDSGAINGTDYDIANSGTIGILATAGQIISTENPAFINAVGSTITDSAALTVDNNGGTIGTLIGVGVYNGLGNVSMTNNGTINANMSNISFAAGSVQPGSTDFVGIYNDASGSVDSLNNGGEIQGAGAGIFNQGTIDVLSNSGVIQATGPSGEGIDNYSGTITTLNNSGTITGTKAALYLVKGSGLGTLNNSGMIAGDIENNTTQTLNIAGGMGADYGTLTGYGNTAGTINSTSASVNFTGGNLLLNDDINVGGYTATDSGAILQVNGAVSFSSSNPFMLTGGILEVGDAEHAGASLTGDINVSDTGILRGHGTVIGNVNNEGEVYPGGSVGVLTINGAYTQNKNGPLEIDVSPNTVSRLVVNGTAELAGAVEFNVSTGFYAPDTRYTVITSKAITGGFTKVEYSSGFSTALGHYLIPYLYNPEPNTLAIQLNPALSSNGEMPIFSTGRFYVASTYVQNNSLQTAVTSPFTVGGPADTVSDGFWLHGIGNFGNSKGYDFNAKGFVVGKGFDLSPHLSVGIGISNVYTTSSGYGSSVTGTSFGAMAYTLYQAGRLNVAASLGVGHLADNNNRYLPYLYWHAHSASNGAYEAIASKVQYSLLSSSSPYLLTPYVEGSYLHTGLGSAQENNLGGLDLHYDALQSNVAQLGAGITGGYGLPVKYGILTGWVSLGGIGTLGNPRSSVTEHLGSYAAKESALAASVGAFTPGVGLQLRGNSAWRVGIGWAGQFGSSISSETFTAQVHYKW